MTARPRRISDDDVLHATARAISRVGPAALTLADVAKEAGIAAPTLIQRFGSKRGLLLAFAAQAPDGLRETFAAARAEIASPLAALVEALVRMTAWIETRESMANHLGFLQMDLADPEFHRHAYAHAERLGDEIAGLLREGMERGEVEAAADPLRLARAVEGMFNGALLSWAIHGEGTVEEAVRQAMRVLLAPYATAASQYHNEREEER